MSVVLRNTMTGEMRTLDGDSNSVVYQTTILQRRASDGRPLWEDTGIHDAMALAQRLDTGALRPEDIGDAGQPFNIINGSPAPINSIPSGQIDRGVPTPTEVAGNAGRAALSADEEFVPTVFNEDGSMNMTTNTSLAPEERPKPLTPPIDSVERMDELNDAASDEMDLDQTEEEDIDDEDEPIIGPDDPRVTDMTNAHSAEELKSMADEAGLPSTGTKTELAQRIVEHDMDKQEPQDQTGGEA